jgi:hypothetical protein
MYCAMPMAQRTIAAMSFYQHTVIQMTKMLRNLDACLKKAAAFAETKGSSPDDFANFKLTFDMRPLTFQVQSACDIAKLAGARLTGVEAPVHPDTETTLAQLFDRIASTISFLETLDEPKFAGAAEREVRLSFIPGQALYGADYLREMALPNFYFHVTTAYALLRMSGVAVGKRDYIGSLTLHPVKD